MVFFSSIDDLFSNFDVDLNEVSYIHAPFHLPGQYIQREGKLKGCVSAAKPGENSAV